MHSLCNALCNHLILALPDFGKALRIENDTSNTAVGGVLTQEHPSVHKLIAFLSKALTNSECNCSFHDYELLAIVTGCKTWHPYIDRL